MTNKQEVTLEVHCRNLPGTKFEERAAVRLGIQKRQDVVDDVAGNVEQVTFTVPLQVQRDPQTGRPRFTGPFAQGTPDDRFIYLCWGERTGSEWDGFRRLKVRLGHLTWSQVEASLDTSEPLTASLVMTDKKGGPICGSVPPDWIRWGGPL